MQVIEAEDERARGSQLFDEFGEFAKHAVASDAQVPLRELRQSRSAGQPRHLSEPRRRPAIEQRGHLVAVRLAAQPPERFQNGDVRLHLAAILQALAASDPGGRSAANFLEERMHESRFAHSRLAGNAHKLPFPFEGRRKRFAQALHLLIALD